MQTVPDKVLPITSRLRRYTSTPPDQCEQKVTGVVLRSKMRLGAHHYRWEPYSASQRCEDHPAAIRESLGPTNFSYVAIVLLLIIGE